MNHFNLLFCYIKYAKFTNSPGLGPRLYFNDSSANLLVFEGLWKK